MKKVTLLLMMSLTLQTVVNANGPGKNHLSYIKKEVKKELKKEKFKSTDGKYRRAKF